MNLVDFKFSFSSHLEKHLTFCAKNTGHKLLNHVELIFFFFISGKRRLILISSFVCKLHYWILLQPTPFADGSNWVSNGIF